MVPGDLFKGTVTSKKAMFEEGGGGVSSTVEVNILKLPAFGELTNTSM